MTATIKILHPVKNVLIAPTDQTIAVEVFDTGTEVTRKVVIIVNAAQVLSVVGGITTGLDPAYSLAVTTPDARTVRYTLTKLTPWANPQTVWVEASYAPSNSESAIDAIAAPTVAATFEVDALSPTAGQADTPQEADLSITIRTPARVSEFVASVNGTFAVAAMLAPPTLVRTVVWNLPAHRGFIIFEGEAIALGVNPRRLFNPDAMVDFLVSTRLTADDIVVIDHQYRVPFHTRPRTTNPLNPALRRTHIDKPFEGFPASEALRVALRSAVQTRRAATSFEVLAYSRIIRSSLGSVRSQFERRDLDEEVSRLVPEDLASVVAADLELGRVAILWDVALDEARTAGVDPVLVELIARTHQEPYPQERVGAVACLIFATSRATA